MSWIYKLYETYENCKSEVGVVVNKDVTPLLPIAHSTQNAQLEIVVSGDGDFIRARVLEKDEVVTIIPVTEDSATRSSNVAPYMGVWIEITSLSTTSLDFFVAPYMGVWIEIDIKTMKIKTCVSLPIWECGLK